MSPEQPGSQRPASQSHPLESFGGRCPGQVAVGTRPLTHIRHWTAAILPTRQLAAGRTIRALGPPIGAYDHWKGREAGRAAIAVRSSSPS